MNGREEWNLWLKLLLLVELEGIEDGWDEILFGLFRRDGHCWIFNQPKEAGLTSFIFPETV